MIRFFQKPVHYCVERAKSNQIAWRANYEAGRCAPLWRFSENSAIM